MGQKIQEAVAAASAVEASFEEVLKLRGKARQPAIDAWYAEHTEHAFAVTYNLLGHKSKSRKTLGQARLATLSFEENREALGELCTELLGGSKYSLYPVALGMLGAHPGLVPDCVETLKAFIPKTHDASQALDALGLIDGAQELTQEAALEIYGAAVDHWATAVQERAAELVVEHGGEARASMWEGCPLSEDVRRQIARLGGSIVGTPDADAPRPITSWEGSFAEGDPSDVVSEVPWPIAYFSKHVRLPYGLDDFDRDFDKNYGSGAYLFHASDAEGRRLLLHDVLYEDHLQWYVTLDLTDTSNDPRAHGWDHEGWDRGRLGSLSRFLGTLKAP